MFKKKFTTLAGSALLGLLAIGGQAFAENAYPNKAITLIVPYAPGGTTDMIARALANGMSNHLKQTIVVENKPGAAGSMGANEMVNTKADGYRVALLPAGIFRQPYLQKTRYDPIEDLTYIAGFANYDFAIGVGENSSIKTIHDYVAYIQNNPNEMAVGTPGQFTGNQVVLVELLSEINGQAVHVPFKSDSESISALLGNQIQAVVSTNIVIPFMESGKVRILATAATERPEAYANVPTLKEAGYDVVVPSPLALGGPKNLPEEVVLRLEEAVKVTTESEAFKKAMADYGVQINFINHIDYTNLAIDTFANEKSIVERLGTE